jgi:hypothetical protein
MGSAQSSQLPHTRTLQPLDNHGHVSLGTRVRSVRDLFSRDSHSSTDSPGNHPYPATAKLRGTAVY